MTAKSHRITGAWLRNGFHTHAGRTLDIIVRDGRAYTNDPLLYEQMHLPVIAGEMEWSASVSFLPNEGELARVGLA